MNNMQISNPALGVYVYSNAVPNSKEIINRLESALGNSNDSLFKWTDSTSSLDESFSNYRSCFDFKISSDYWQFLTPEFEGVRSCYEELERNFDNVMDIYKEKFNIKLDFKEAMLFVKYGEGHHFATHVDHGANYSLAVSALAYLNDDYEGGELGFPILDLEIKPKAGDIVVFPSSYIYSHKVNVVKSGTRYSVLVGHDYGPKFHPKVAPTRMGIPRVYNSDNDTVFKEGDGFSVMPDGTKVQHQ
jgi:hypothetical protein